MRSNCSAAARLKRLEAGMKPGEASAYTLIFLEHGETLREVIDRDFGGAAPPKVMAIEWVKADEGMVAEGYLPAGEL